MAKIELNPGADPLQVAQMLDRIGITMGQQLPDGTYVAYVNRRTWLVRQYPELLPVFQEDRRFWKSVRARTRNGENVPQSEIEAHAKQLNAQIDQIIYRYDHPRNPSSAQPTRTPKHPA